MLVLKYIYSKRIFAKYTRLACLLSFVSLFISKPYLSWDNTILIFISLMGHRMNTFFISHGGHLISTFYVQKQQSDAVFNGKFLV